MMPKLKRKSYDQRAREKRKHRKKTDSLHYQTSLDKSTMQPNSNFSSDMSKDVEKPMVHEVMDSDDDGDEEIPLHPRDDIPQREDEYEFDADVDLEELIDAGLKNLDLSSAYQNLICPLESQIITIDRNTTKATSIFEDANKRLDKIIVTLTDKRKIDGEIVHVSDHDSDDDIQFVASTQRPSNNQTSLVNIPTAQVSQLLVSPGGQYHYIPVSNIPGGQKLIVKQGSGPPRHVIIQQRTRVPFYKTVKQQPKLDIKVGTKVYAKKGNEIWYKGILQEVQKPDKENPDGRYRVKFDGKGMKQLTGKQIALLTNDMSARLPLGTRVVAQYRDEDSTPAISHYAGIVAESPSIRNQNRYLIFFDDGYAQYNMMPTVHRVYDQSDDVWEDIHPDSQEFIKSYLLQYPERPMVRLQKNQILKTEWNGKWWTARVHEVDASLVKMFFDADQRIEWIYRGSTRLEPLYTELAQAEANKVLGVKGRLRHSLGVRKKNKPYVEYTRGNSDDELQIIDKDENTCTSGPTHQTARKSTGARAVAKKSTGGGNTNSPITSVPQSPTSQYEQNSRPSFTLGVNKQTSPNSKKEYQTSSVSNIISTSPNKDIALARRLAHNPLNENPGETIEVALDKLRINRPFKRYVLHVCSPTCILDDDPVKCLGINPLRIPLYYNWDRVFGKVRMTSGKRLHVYYTAPCGRRLRSEEDLVQYLNTTDSRLTCDLFCFDQYLHILHEFAPIKTFCDIKDISYGKETVPISCVNGIDRQYPDYVEYSNQRIPAKGVKLNLDPEFLSCCDCTDNCQDKSKCACCQLTVIATGAADPNAETDTDAGYRSRRLEQPLITGIYECNSKCLCDQRCHNRVAQNGLQLRLQVFKTEKRGWGIRCLDDIPAGGFICIYAGQLLTEQAANEDGHQYGDEYLAELDHIEVIQRNKEGFEEDVIDPLDEDIDVLSSDNISLDSDGSEYSGHAHVKFDTDEAPVHNTRRRSKRRASKDGKIDSTGKIGKIIIKRNSLEQGSEGKTWSVNKRSDKDSSAQKTADWLKSIPDATSAISLSDDEDKKVVVDMDADELPDLAPDGTQKKRGKSHNTENKEVSNYKKIPRKKLPSSSSNRDPVDEHDSDDSEDDINKKEKSRFMNPKTPIPSLKIKLSTMEVQNKVEEEKKRKHASLRSFFNEEFCYIMDAKSIGNLGRYLNHSCTPNVFVQNVFVDTQDLRFPWVGFFAQQLIRAGTELTWDYNYEVGSVPGKVLYCYCGSAECRGRLL